MILISEDILSEVELFAELTKGGLSVTARVDDCEFEDFIEYEAMAYHMIGDRDAYPVEDLKAIQWQLRGMADILGVAIDDATQSNRIHTP